MKTATAIDGSENLEDAKVRVSANPYTPYEAKVSLHEITDMVSHLQGEMLTIVEASMPEGKQLEALKSLVRNSLWKTQEVVSRWYYAQTNGKAEPFPYANNVPRSRSTLPVGE